MSWTDYASAPPPGTPVCRAVEIGGAETREVTSERGAFPLVLVRTGGEVRAYVNACPHQFLPLDHRGPRILSADGSLLMCSNHGAMFDAATGEGVAGEGLGCALDPVPLDLRDGRLVIGTP